MGDVVGESEKLPFERHMLPGKLWLALVVFKVIFIFYLVCASVRVHACVHVCMFQTMRKSEDDLKEPMLSFHREGHRDPSWGFRPGFEHLYSLSSLAGRFVSETGTRAGF